MRGHVKKVEKAWGYELWLVNNSRYCGKHLIINPGFRTSLHRHLVKDETFYVEKGPVLVQTGKGQGAYEHTLLTGETLHIAPGIWHRMTGFEAASPVKLVEISTFHDDKDVERAEAGGPTP